MDGEWGGRNLTSGELLAMVRPAPAWADLTPEERRRMLARLLDALGMTPEAQRRRAMARHLGALPLRIRAWYWLVGVPERLKPDVRR